MNYSIWITKFKLSPLTSGNFKILNTLSFIMPLIFQLWKTKLRTETFDTLLEDGYMIPNRDQLNALGLVAEGKRCS